MLLVDGEGGEWAGMILPILGDVLEELRRVPAILTLCGQESQLFDCQTHA